MPQEGGSPEGNTGEASIRIDHGRRAARSYHIAVEGRYDPRYWMHLEMPMNLDLRALDRFLRDTWLECCGHLSAFCISGVTYQSHSVDLLGPFGGRRPENMRSAAQRVNNSSSIVTYSCLATVSG